MRKLSLRLTLLLLLLVLSLSLAHRAQAQAKSVVVPHRDADITIAPNGDVNVVETWQVQFIGGPFHTAFRSFDMTRIEDISALAISEGNQPYAHTTAQTSGTFYTIAKDSQRDVQWYFDPTTNATRTFTLHYTLHGVVRIYPGGDQLWWQFIEADRAYPINAAHVVEHLPGSISADQLKLATTGGGRATRADANTVTFDGGPFAPNEAWEIRTEFPHGIVTAPAPAWQAAADAGAVIQFAQLGGGIILLLAGLLGALVWYYARVRRKPVPLAAEYLTAPPDQLTPGLAGTLVSNRAGIQDVVATLVDLARRGFLKMSAQGADYSFERVNGGDAKTLRPYEQKLLEYLFSNSTRRQLSDPTDRIFLTLREPEIESALGSELASEGYFAAPAGNTRSPFFWIMTALFWGAVAFGVLSLFVLHNMTWLTAFDLIVIIVVTIAVTIVMSRKPITTALGAQAVAQWMAFKRYLQDINKYTQVADAQAQFEKYLPYAIAFGVAKNWLNAFASVSTPAPAWYHWDDDDESERRDARSKRTYESTGSTGSAHVPSLNEMADNSFRGLNNMSESFFGMLNSTASAFTSPSSSKSSDRDSSSSSNDHGSSGSSDREWSGGGSSGGASGGGSSGFG